MGTLDYTEAMVQIDQGDISPLYLFYGEEFFLAERLVTRLRTLLVRPESAELTYYRFYGEELNLAELLDLLHSIPFFASRRLVILQHSEKLKKGDLAPLIAYCQQPLETNCLVFLAEKPNLKDPLYATIARQGRVVHLRRLYRNQLTRWLEQEARQLGYRLTPEAASALVEQGGEQLALLYSELQKVITYCGRQKQITLPDVQAVGGNDKMHSIFDLTDALARRQIGEGLKALNRLLAYGEPPLLILRMITRQFRLLWQAKVYRQAGHTEEQIAKQIGLHRYFLRELLRNAERFETEELRTIFMQLRQLDITLKTRSIPPRHLLEKLVIDLCLLRRG